MTASCHNDRYQPPVADDPFITANHPGGEYTDRLYRYVLRLAAEYTIRRLERIEVAVRGPNSDGRHMIFSKPIETTVRLSPPRTVHASNLARVSFEHS